MNDPSAGSPTETLLRLLFPLSAKVCLIFRKTIKKTHLNTQSVKATGGVYILQGRNQHEMMTRGSAIRIAYRISLRSSSV